MKTLVLGSAVGAVAVGTAVELTITPFTAKRSALGMINVSPDFNGTYIIQGSDDGVTYSDMLTVTGTNQENAMAELQTRPYMRGNMTAWTAGSASSLLAAGV